MHEFERSFGRRSIKPDAIIAFVVGTLAAYVVTQAMGTSSRIFMTIIVAAVGGLWYKIRNVL